MSSGRAMPGILQSPGLPVISAQSQGSTDLRPERDPLPPNLVCRRSDGLLSVIEKCLNNSFGRCLVVDEESRPLGEVSLDEIRLVLRDGRLTSFQNWAEHLAIQPSRNADLPREGKFLPD